MSDINQQIADIEKEIRETPYHKATEQHIGKLRARLARLKDKEIESSFKKGGGGGGGYAVKKQGDATIVLIGPPSSGKSTLINKLTNAESKVAPYAFTTVSVIPGMLKYKDAYIQILDVPGLIQGAKVGRGRGKEVLSVARGADLLLIMTEVDRLEILESLVKELEESGIRINKHPPDVRIEKKFEGGLTVRTNISQDISKETICEMAKEFGIKNGDVTIKEKLELERLIDSFSSNRVYVPALFVVNKVDLGRPKKSNLQESLLYISAESEEGLPELKEAIWSRLGFLRVYLVKPGSEPNFDNPIVMRQGETLKGVALKIGTDFGETKKLAKIWGKGAKFSGQEVSLQTAVSEGMRVRFL